MEHPKRKGLKSGVRTEFTVFANLKPGQEKAVRETIQEYGSHPGRLEAIRALSILHEARFVVFDNGARLLFCDSFDGPWDKYIDYASTTIIATLFDAVWSHTEGYPGMADLDRVKDWFMSHAVEGLQMPPGSHTRRTNPRDQFRHEVVRVNRHRLLRRGTAYGPLLPEGVLEDDGADRGIFFVFIGADLKRQFEFVQSEWVNQGIFIGAPAEKDPISGPNDGTGMFTIPKQPIRQRLQGVPRFVTNRGGEYFFMPSLRALRWLADAAYGAEEGGGAERSPGS